MGTFRFPFLFFSEGVRLAGTLHRNVADLLTPQPAVVLSGSWLAVKEQMADCYARELASRGYSAFTLDFAGFGQSEGMPRQAEIPTRKTADIHAAHALRCATLVHPRQSRLLLAICASAQYTFYR